MKFLARIFWETLRLEPWFFNENLAVFLSLQSHIHTNPSSMSYVGLVLGPNELENFQRLQDFPMTKMVNMCPFFYFNKEKSLQATACEQTHQLIWEIDREKREVSGSPFFHKQFIPFFSNKTFFETKISALFPYLISAKKKKSLLIKFKTTSTVQRLFIFRPQFRNWVHAY